MFSMKNYIIDRAVKKDIWHLIYVTNKDDRQYDRQWSIQAMKPEAVVKIFLNATFIV